MKNLKKLILVIFAIAIFGCNEDILQEKPLDFLSPENSYTTPEGIESSLFRNYAYLKNFYNGNDPAFYIHSGTDLCTAARNPAVTYLGDYSGLTSTSGLPSSYWSTWYKVIYNSNVIINRIEGVEYPSEKEKAQHIAEARWFRGYAYKILANLFGGVPIVLEEILEPKRDFVRASREEVYNQAIEDMVYAVQNLPGVTEVAAPGRINNAAANHILSELYISVGQWDKAIAAADAVISDPNINIMTTRFGKRASQEDGDPYWDLFQVGNVNRGNGNNEGILVLQDELYIPGGTDPIWWSGSGFFFERIYGPLFWQLKDPDGVFIFNNKPYSSNGGRPVGLVRPTNYFSYIIWDSQNRDTDIRNSNLNIIRDWKVINPASAYFGEWCSTIESAFIAQDTMLRWYPFVGKCTTIDDHPASVIADPATGELNGQTGKTLNDWYLIRVAETYLLRAEAKLGKGDKPGAAADINVIRNRANATPVEAGTVTIDYILDERMRELNYEEGRRMTLGRLNKIYDRTVLGNQFAGQTIQPFNNLFPIPFNEIERNTGAVLEQNPGYN